jgi:phage gpG-like protein
MADSILIDFKAAAQFLNEKRFKHGLHGEVQASIGARISRITKRRMGVGTKPIQKWTQATRAGKSGKPLQDDGHLKASIQWDRVPQGVEIGSALKYARIHQEGGVIVPKKAKMLTVPATHEAREYARSLGIRRSIELFAEKYGAIWWGKTAIYAGKTLVFWRYKRVTIPARPYLYWDKEREDEISEIMQNYLEDGQVK